MSRVLPLIKKTAIKNNIMLQPVEMDLGLGSLPDLLFGEELSLITAVQHHQPLDEVQKKNESQSGSSKSLFDELEAFNNGWREDFELDEPIQTVDNKQLTKALPLNILDQAVSECDIFPDTNDFQLVPSADDTQKLINDMEDFLVHHESESSPMDTNDTDNSTTTQLTESESKQAEEILDALIAGNISLDLDSFNDSSSAEDASMTSAADDDDSGYLSNISNISEFVTEEGQKVVIVIANDVDPPVRPILPKSPSASSLSSAEAADSDPDWAPSPAPAKAGVKSGKVAKPTKAKRGPYKRAKSSHANVHDKKERKKLQNVEAARRYRDKKKAEASIIGSEESQLASRNAKLKEELGEIESEVKTLKKLMKELGLVK